MENLITNIYADSFSIACVLCYRYSWNDQRVQIDFVNICVLIPIFYVSVQFCMCAGCFFCSFPLTLGLIFSSTVSYLWIFHFMQRNSFFFSPTEFALSFYVNTELKSRFCSIFFAVVVFAWLNRKNAQKLQFKKELNAWKTQNETSKQYTAHTELKLLISIKEFV